MALRHFLSINDLTASELRKVLQTAIKLKEVPRKQQLDLLPGA